VSTEPTSAEFVVARLRGHGRRLFWPNIALLFVAGAAGYLVGRFSEQWQNLAALGVAGLLIVLLWLVPSIGWLGRNYTITTRRVIVRSGFLVRSRQELLLSRSYDVTVRKHGLQVLFGSGDVEINGGSDQRVTLRDVPSANLVQAALHDLIEANPAADFPQQQG
jgi:uncharacterized membrane protein YdbT with pleckstrin-like domain